MAGVKRDAWVKGARSASVSSVAEEGEASVRGVPADLVLPPGLKGEQQTAHSAARTNPLEMRSGRTAIKVLIPSSIGWRAAEHKAVVTPLDTV